MALLANVIRGSEATRLLLLLHGYGADERDLGGLLPYLDPDGRFAAVLPRGPHRGAGRARLRVVPDLGRGRRRRPRSSTRSTSSTRSSTSSAPSSASPRAEAIFGGFSQGAGVALALALRGGDATSDRPACSR